MDDEHYSPEYGMELTSQGAGTYWWVFPDFVCSCHNASEFMCTHQASVVFGVLLCYTEKVDVIWLTGTCHQSVSC